MNDNNESLPQLNASVEGNPRQLPAPAKTGSVSRRRPRPKPRKAPQKVAKDEVDGGALIVRLQQLRVDAKQISSTYLASLDRQIGNLIAFVGAKPNKGSRKQGEVSRSLRQILKTLDRLSVKPKQGRRKDLKRIESSLESMTDRLAARPKAGQKKRRK